MFRFLFITILYSLSLFAHTISIDTTEQKLDILKNANIFIDKKGKISFEEIAKIEQFEPINKNFLNLGYIFHQTVWIQFSLKNTSDKPLQRYLVVDAPNVDILELYSKKKGEIVKQLSGIFHREKFNNELFFSFDILLQPNETQTYFLALRPLTHSLRFHLQLKTLESLKNDELKNQLILTIFFSILFVVFFYNITIYFYTKDKLHLYYALFVAMVFIHQFSIRGMIAYILPDNVEIITTNAYMPVYNLAFLLLSILYFVKAFLNISKYPKFNFILNLFAIGAVVILFINSKENYLLPYITLLSLLFVLFLEFLGLYLFITKKEKYAKYFFFIWSISLFGFLISITYHIGLLDHPFSYTMEVTTITEVLFFSIILAMRLDESQKEKEKKEKIITQQSKLAAMGEMLQNISHQWRQPLCEINSIVMQIDTLFRKKMLSQSKLDENLEKIENITEYLSKTIESFNTYFRKDTVQQNISLETTLHKALNILEYKLQDVDLNIFVHSKEIFKHYSNDLVQIFLIVLNNAIDAMNEKKIQNKKLSISVEKKELQHIITFEDNAGGIDAHIIEKIFEPYFTTKFQLQGTGIGLFIAKQLIEQKFQGSIEVSNTINGAKFKIII